MDKTGDGMNKITQERRQQLELIIQNC